MDPALAAIMEKNTPALNRDLADGLAVKHLKQAEPYIDAQIRSVAKYFPSDLVYEGFRRCTPHEEYREITRRSGMNNSNKCTYNLARSDTYMVAYKFRFKGEEIIRYISLPFLNHKGTMYVSDVQYLISPVICDKIISVGVKDIFVKLNLGKLIFRSEPQYYVANGEREMIQLIHSEVYNRTKKNKALVKNVRAKTTMTHYLLCRYGFKETFKQFAACNPILGYEEINPDNYPPEDWVICESIGVKLRSLILTRGESYHPTKIRMAIKKEEYTSKAKNHIVTFFYLLDHWPQRVRVEDVEEVCLWKQLMGELLWGSNAPLGRLESDTEKHLESLDNYIDNTMKFKFAAKGMPIDNLYQLFGIIMENYAEWLLNGNSTIVNMYTKELEVLYYVLKDICRGINNFYFRLTNTYNKKGGNVDVKEIRNIFNATMKTGLVYKISSSGQDRHIEVSTVNTSCDNKAYKSTAVLVPQETTGRNDDNKSNDDPTQYLHTSVAEVNAYSAINKRDPSGHNRINHCVNITDQGIIKRNPKFKSMLDDIQPLLDRTL